MSRIVQISYPRILKIWEKPLINHAFTFPSGFPRRIYLASFWGSPPRRVAHVTQKRETRVSILKIEGTALHGIIRVDFLFFNP